MSERHQPSGTCDVLIVGAGPAGSAAALTLSASPEWTGARIVLIDSSQQDEFRIGESLPPDSRELLDQLGVLPEFLTANHQPCLGSVSCWGNEHLGFNDFAVNINGHGWHLERARFDAMLATQAAGRGIELQRGWRFVGTETSSKEGSLVHLHSSEGVKCKLTARWVLDASGMTAIFAHAMGSRRLYDDKLISIAGVFELNDDASVDRRTMLEATPYGWWYCARLNTKEAIVSMTTDVATARERAMNSIPSWFKHLAKTQHMGERLHGNRLSSAGIRRWAAPSFRLNRCTGVNWMAMGDSALSYDPIVAQGIHKSLETGVAAARALSQRVSGVSKDFAEYEQSVLNRHEQYITLRNTLYSLEQRWVQESFWKSRHSLV